MNKKNNAMLYKYSMIVVCVLVVLFLLAPIDTAQAAPITVSPGHSIQSAANGASPGDTITVLAGNFPELVTVTRPGIHFVSNGIVHVQGFKVMANDVWIQGFSISNQSPNDEHGIYAKGSNIVIDTNSITDVPNDGILLDVGTTNAVVKNNIITKARNSCLWVTGQQNLIENNECSHTIQPTTTGADADCFRYFGSGHTFRGNYCHDIPTDGVLVRDAHTDCFQTWNWPSVGGVGHDILFEKNACILPFVGPAFSAKIWQAEEGAYNLTMKNNVGVANMIALLIDAENISFFNNTFVGMSRSSDGLHLQRAKVTLYNNIFAHQQQRVIENIETSAMITASNNCYSDYGIMLPANPGDIRSTNALFVNESLGNYHLLSNAPCKDKGMTIASIIDDKDGVSRPQDVAYDMGAYEYQSDSTSPNDTSVVPSDLNHDSIINVFDYRILVRDFGNPYTIFDYRALVTHYGQ